MKPGHYMDALLECTLSSPDKNIEKHLKNSTIETRRITLKKKKFLVIPGVNTLEVAKKIRKLAFL